MTLASLVSVIIRDISEIRGQILQPLISRMTRIMGTERPLQALVGYSWPPSLAHAAKTARQRM